MAEVKIDELLVTAVSPLPPEIKIDELNVTAVVKTVPTMSFDSLYSRGIAKLPASITINNLHAGALRRKIPATRFKLGYKEEVLGSLGDALGQTLLPANYDLTLGTVVAGQPEYVNLRLTAKKPSGYRRYSDVTYRRSDVETLLPLIDLESLKPTVSVPLDTTAQIIARINTLFGTKLTELDFVEAPTQAGVERVLTTRAESFYFQPGGQITLGRLDQTERTTEIVGLAWSEVDKLPFRTHSADFTVSAAALAGLTGSTLVNDTQASAVVTALTTALGAGHGVTSAYYSSNGRGIRSLPIQTLTLPAVTTLPVDNSGFYNRALVIDMDLSAGFDFRYLILHYNV